MVDKSILCAKIIKTTALVLAFLLLFKAILRFLLSFAILEEPPRKWPQRLKDDCCPRWYGWFSLLLNSFCGVVHFYMYLGILKANKNKLYLGLLGVVAYLSVAILTHLVMLIEYTELHTMQKLNWIGVVFYLLFTYFKYPVRGEVVISELTTTSTNYCCLLIINFHLNSA